jgi:CSLREA domain-containing protein
VNYGADGTPVTAVPDTGYHFVNWSDSSTQNPRTDTNVTADISVTANFAVNTYTLTYTAGANGSISGTSPQTVNYGADGTPVTAVPDTGYHFVNWSDSSTQNPRTDTNVTADISVTATFAADLVCPPSLTVNDAGDDSDATPGDGVCETGASNGICTLRAAIMEANAEGSCPSPIEIQFGIASPGVQTISPASPLPAVTVPVIIDGYSQPGTSVNTLSDSTDNAVILIELTGVNAGAGADGIVISGGGSTVEGLIINRFLGAGVKLTGAGTNNVTGNFIGTDATGMLTVDGSNVPYGNHIGVLIDNTGDNMIGCDTEDERNVIAGNADDGISIAGTAASQNLVWGNLIGVGAGGSALANGGAGVAIYDASDNSIGLDVDGNGRGNFIGFNGGNGVEVKFGTMIGPAPPTRDNVISQNLIHDNVGLGIDLGDPGVTPNDETSPPFDSDSGPNDLQNFPEINVATAGATNTIGGNLHSTPDQTFTLEFFASTSCNAVSPNDYGEGQMYLGSASVSTDGNGDTPFIFNPLSLTPGQVVTATATDANGNTSEFSQCFPVTSANTNPTITAATGLSRQQGNPQGNSIIATVNDTESGPNGVTVTVTSANPSNGVTISNIQNANDNSGHITADIIADCTATDPATFTLQASDGSGGTATDTLTITVTPKTAPTLSYNTPQTVTEGNSLTINPATGPSGNAASIVVQDAGGYPGSLSVDNSTGVVTVSNAVSPGSYTIKIRATGNCTDQTDATFTLTVNAAACDTPPAGMVAWYPGDGNADDVQGPTFESGTLQNGATFAPGKVDRAFSFDGVNQGVLISSGALPNIPASGQFTVDLWLNPSNINGIRTMFQRERSYLYIDNGVIKSNIGNNPTSTGIAAPAGQWTHAALTYDNGAVNIYVNGVLAASSTRALEDQSGDATSVGYDARFNDEYFPGLIDEVEFFNSALQVSDVANIYNASFAGKCRTCTTPPSGMVSWWDGSGASTTANDIADGNNGTLQNGAAFASGKVGQGFGFDGVDDQILVAHNANQNTGAQITLDAWIRPTAVAPLNSNPSIINKRTAANSEGYTFEVNNAGNGLYFEITTSNGVFSATAANALTLNTWQHVAATFDGANLRIFLNGSQVASSAGTGTINAVTSDLVIGRNIALGTSFTGQIDEVELFNRALSQIEIATIADAGAIGKCHTSTVTVAVSPSAVLEDGAANLVYTFTRSGDITSPLTVNFSVAGTATFGSDYTQSGAATFSASAGTVDFPASTSTATVTIDPTPDTTYELAESVMLTVSPSANYNVGSPNQATGTINNDDDAPVLKIGNVTASEGTNPPGTTPFTFTVTKTGSTEATATVSFDTSDGATNPATGGGSCGGSVDYISQTGGVISFAPNETSKTVTIQVCRDATAEANETFLVDLSGATHATIAEGEGRGTIQNDDTPPPLSPVNTTDDTNDGVCNAAHCSLREAINQANLTSTPVSITFAIPDDDHLNAGGPRHFYYKNDGVANHLTNDAGHLGVTLTSEATLPADIDPDWPHSWWSIQTSAVLPTISPQALISIDAYTQTGATANTLTGADNAVLRIELTPGGSVPASTTGLSLSGLTASVKGLVVNRFSGDGISLASGNKSLTGNFIGTDVSGTLDLGNAGSGINSPSGFSETIGGGTAADINLISGNNGNGLSFSNSNTNLILGNLIGTKADGAGSLGNSGTGISLSGAGSVANTIGGINSGEGNTIAFNGSDGVRLADASFGNSIRGNSILSNGSTANDLGIDLGTDGVTANDSMDGDTGPNTLQNFPVITLAQVTGSTRTITGTLNSTPDETFNIDFYSNASCDTAGGNGEGKTYLGSISVTTDNTTGDASFTFHPTTLTVGQVVTATATSSGAQFNTSEFSACATVQSGDAGAGDIQFTSATYTINENDPGGVAAITLTRVGGTNGQVQTSFTTSNGSATAGSDYTDSSQTVVFNEGESSKTINIPISDDGVYEGNETVNLTLGSTTINAPVGGGNPPSVDPHAAVLTIVDNDAAPTLAINDVTQNEGSGGTTTFTFHITKTGATEVSASVTVNTANGTASAPGDYAAIVNQVVTFAANETDKTVGVSVVGDTVAEADETFFVNLSSPANATISDSQGLGTITNDDCPASFTVNDNGDAPDASPGDGTCATAGAVCTLRAAIEEANASLNSCGAIDINFSGVTTPINLNTALPAINHNLNINGPSASGLTVQRNTAGSPPNFRIFTINSGMTVTISDLTVSNGRLTGASKGGGILNNGTLTLARMKVTGNTCTNGAGVANDGGVLKIITSTISGNNASGGAAGGIGNYSGTLTVANSTISSNTSDAQGGGVGNFGGGSSPVATATFTNTTIASNVSTGQLTSGIGGIYNGSGNNILTLTNCTVSANIATGTGSGGVAGVFNGSGGPTASTTNLANTIVAGNTTTSGSTIVHDLNGTFNSQDYNLIGSTSGATFTGAVSHNVTNVSAMLGSLANNGGPTQTMVLLPGSPAINAGSNANLPTTDPFDLDGDSITAEPLPVDQRGVGFNRIINTTVDIGAVEVNYAISTTAGSGQSAQINSAFATALKATVTESGNPVSGIPVTFTAPASGPSGTFASSATVNTDASGVATAPVFTANGISNNQTPYNVTASLAGGVGSTNFSLTNLKGNQTITVNTHAPATASYNSSFTVAATASSGQPVAYSSSGSCTNAGAMFTVTSGTGTCTVKYDQAGDSNYNSAPQVTESVTAQKAGTSTTVSSSVNPSDFGQNVTFTATVTSGAGTPTGSVQFKDGGSAITCANTGSQTQALSSGIATCQISTLAAGPHTITADYSGDSNFTASTGTLPGGQVVRTQPSLSIDDVSMTEGDSGTKNFTFTITLSTASNLTVTVNYATADGTANSGSDYVAVAPTPVTFSPGQTVKTVDVTVNGDQTFEPNETFSVNLSNATNATISDSQGVGTIVNDDAQGGIISFSQGNYLVNENGGAVTITVNRTGDTSGSASVDYTTPDDSEVANVPPCSQTDSIARPRCDFTTALGTLQFAPGETSKTFTVLISQDNFAEGSEGLQLTLSNLTAGAVFGVNSTAVLTINDDPTEPSTNPIDDPENFVRQHYHDFLNREPDASGLGFWKGQITECGSDAQCIEVKRINVSGAFYLSIEFQGTGYFVERVYKSALGDANRTANGHPIKVPMVRFREFLGDTQKIGQGVIVLVGDWEHQLDLNKSAFTADFVKRPVFSSTYPTTLTPQQFVDALFTNTGVSPSAADRQAAIDEFGGTGNTADLAARGRALRRVADNATFNQQEFNRAFVLMQYFGYLRRNPDAQTSGDYEGYEFWLTKLNAFNGDFVRAEMVKAFIASTEYRNRFGH